MHWTGHVLFYLLCYLALWGGVLAATSLGIPEWVGLVAVILLGVVVRIVWGVRRAE